MLRSNRTFCDGSPTFSRFSLFQGGYRLRPARYYDSAENVSVRPVSLPLMAEPKGKKVLDVDIYARDTEGGALHEQHCQGTVR
jgi:hypothetical protein